VWQDNHLFINRFIINRFIINVIIVNMFIGKHVFRRAYGLACFLLYSGGVCQG
jgi:hypothetical protein